MGSMKPRSLTPEQETAVRDEYAPCAVTMKELAAKYGVHERTISRIISPCLRERNNEENRGARRRSRERHLEYDARYRLKRKLLVSA
jgi:hypothetical protein